MTFSMRLIFKNLGVLNLDGPHSASGLELLIFLVLFWVQETSF